MRRFQALLILSFTVFYLILTTDAQAATLVVTKTADTNDNVCDTDCSLREAIAAANTAGDTITFGSLFNSPQTITLDSSLGWIVVGKTVTIQGPGANLLTISANGASGVFNCGINSSRIVTLSGMKITGGSSFEGGGVRKPATLNLTNVIITGNTAPGGGRGGGVANACCGSQLNITNSIISNNTASGSNASGGGIFNSSGSLNGVPGKVTINGSTISGNTAASEGGGIFSNSTLVINGSTISGNQTTGANGGGIHINAPQTTIDMSTISGNSSGNAGGGISIVTSTGNTVGITNSTISGNTTVFGAAGINSNGATTTLTNVTVSNNTATNASSYNGGVNNSNGTLNTRNSIFAGNTAAANPDVRGAFTSQGYNLVGIAGTATGFTGTGDQTGTVASPLNAKLAPLGNYGGATMTHALLKNSNPALNSPAIDAADTVNPPATDQRGVSRPQDGDNNASSRADIGAFEVAATSSNYSAALPSATVSQSGYSITIAPDNTQNGTTYNYCISTGTLPPGLSGINPCPGQLTETNQLLTPQAAVVISGIPTQSGTFNFTIRAFDSNGNATETNYLLTVAAAPQVCTPPPAGMVGWYAGDGNADDISGVHNNGTFVNGATAAPGMVGQAFSFDGVNDYVQIPSVSPQDLTVAATLDAWVRFSQTPSQAGRHMEIISKGSFGSDFDLGALTDDRFYLYISGGINVGSTTVIQPNVWYHVAGTWDSTGLRMYINGVLENTNSTPNVTRSAQPTRPLTIGNGTEFDRNQRWFSGLIDEAEIFNRALSATEIQAIYNAQSAGKCKGAATNVISGRVIYALDSQKGVSGVAVSATGATSANTTTDRSGAYLLENLTTGGQYTVSVTKSGGANGITAFDATLILRHAAAGGTGPNALTATQQQAANTDGLNGITAFDATLILRYVAANGANANTGQAGNWILTPTLKNYAALNNSAFDENYTAILIGEVSGDYIAP